LRATLRNCSRPRSSRGRGRAAVSARHAARCVVDLRDGRGSGAQRRGRVQGLRHALVLAGAHTQVVSLWKVDDDATTASWSITTGACLQAWAARKRGARPSRPCRQILNVSIRTSGRPSCPLATGRPWSRWRKDRGTAPAVDKDQAVGSRPIRELPPNQSPITAQTARPAAAWRTS
jgi:hypothetical protein